MHVCCVCRVGQKRTAFKSVTRVSLYDVKKAFYQIIHLSVRSKTDKLCVATKYFLHKLNHFREFNTVIVHGSYTNFYKQSVFGPPFIYVVSINNVLYTCTIIKYLTIAVINTDDSYHSYLFTYFYLFTYLLSQMIVIDSHRINLRKFSVDNEHRAVSPMRLFY